MSAPDVYVTIVFYVAAVAMVVSAIGMVVVRDMIRSALLLVVSLSGVGVTYVLLSADFLAVVQLLVYVGAIMILVLFAIMLTPGQVDLLAAIPQGQRIAAVLTAVAIGAISIWAMLIYPWKIRPTLIDAPTAETFGGLLMTNYVLPFWIASILLTVGMIGAIVIARED